jgi:GNAT superfamily N-acetyltransferase
MEKLLQKVEMSYIEMFSSKIDKPYGAMFEDTNQRDKHMHNILFVYKNAITPKDIQDYLDDTEQYGFSNIVFNGIDVPKHINKKLYQISPYGYYGCEMSEISIMPKREISLYKVDPKSDQDIFEFIFNDDQQFGVEYAKNNHLRLKEVLLKNHHRFHYYKLIHEGKMIGHINVYYYEDIAKIDDFYILEPYQRQGFGISMLSKIMDILKERHIKYVYLITNELEEAKYIYQSIGMKKVSFYHELKIKTLDLWD